MSPGTMKDIPHADETKTPAMREPRMFPTEVCEFHTPMMNPRLVYCKEEHRHTEAVRTSVAPDGSENNTGTSVFTQTEVVYV